MRYIFDTTYLLPLVGISVKELSQEEIQEFLKKEEVIALSQITFFELAAKGAKYVSAGKLDEERVARGIRALLEDDSIVKLDPYTEKQLSTAIRLRGMLGDFIDCMIVADAINYGDVLLTEDGRIHELKKKDEFKELLSGLKIQRLAECIRR